MLANKSLADHYMQEYGLDALVATQPVSIKYVSGLDCWVIDWLREWMGESGGSNSTIPLYCVLPHDAGPILVLPCDLGQFGFSSFSKDIRLYGSPPDVPARPEDLSIDLTRLAEADRSVIRSYIGSVYSSATEAVVSIMKEKGLDRSRIGIELQGFSQAAFKEVTKHLKGATFQDCTEVIRLTRMIKTDEEIALLTRSAELNERAMQESARSIKENATFGQVSSTFRRIVEQGGGSPEHCIFSQHGCGVSDRKDYVFRKDQCILLDAGAYRANYVSDTGTTVFTGKLAAKHRDTFKRIHECIDSGLDAVKAGAQCSRVAGSLLACVKKNSLDGLEPYGHGIGLQPSEYPLISTGLDYVYHDGFGKRSADFALEKNMTVCLEAPYYVFGDVSYTIEVTAVVSQGGYKDLVMQNRAEPIMNY